MQASIFCSIIVTFPFYFFQFDKIPKFDSPLYRHGVSTISGAVERGINFVFMRHLALLPRRIQFFCFAQDVEDCAFCIYTTSLSPQFHHFPCSPLKSFGAHHQFHPPTTPPPILRHLLPPLGPGMRIKCDQCWWDGDMLFNERSTTDSLAEFDKSLTCGVTLKMAELLQRFSRLWMRHQLGDFFFSSRSCKSIIHQTDWPLVTSREPVPDDACWHYRTQDCQGVLDGLVRTIFHLSEAAAWKKEVLGSSIGFRQL